MAEQEVSFFKGLMPGDPLWKIAPTRDEDGNSFSDFMMIIPKLKKKPQHYIDKTLTDIQMVLNRYSNCLWVTHKAQLGLCKELADAIRQYVPEATLVGDMSR